MVIPFGEEVLEEKECGRFSGGMFIARIDILHLVISLNGKIRKYFSQRLLVFRE